MIISNYLFIALIIRYCMKPGLKEKYTDLDIKPMIILDQNTQVKSLILICVLIPLNCCMACQSRLAQALFPYIVFMLLNLSIFMTSHDHYYDIRDFTFEQTIKYFYSHLVLIMCECDARLQAICFISGSITFVYSLIQDYLETSLFLCIFGFPVSVSIILMIYSFRFHHRRLMTEFKNMGQ